MNDYTTEDVKFLITIGILSIHTILTIIIPLPEFLFYIYSQISVLRTKPAPPILVFIDPAD